MPIISECQNQTSVNNKDSSSNGKAYKPEVLTSGFIDVANSGQINASARFIKIFIGEPGKFAIPLSIFGGVSNNNFQNQNTVNIFQRNNEQLINHFINPLSGLMNISIDGVFYFKRNKKITRSGFLYHLGERVLTGYKIGTVTDPQTGNPVNFLNSFLASGFYFETGAWERHNSKNVGIFWLALRGHFCYSNPKQLKSFLGSIETNGIYSGYSVGFGVEINNLINLKTIYYKYIKEPEISYVLPIYQFSFNYALKN
jgi:hypothetical protein